MEKDKILFNGVYGIFPNNFDFKKIKMVQNEIKRLKMGGDKGVHLCPEPDSLRSMETQPLFQSHNIYKL